MGVGPYHVGSNVGYVVACVRARETSRSMENMVALKTRTSVSMKEALGSGTPRVCETHKLPTPKSVTRAQRDLEFEPLPKRSGAARPRTIMSKTMLLAVKLK